VVVGDHEKGGVRQRWWRIARDVAVFTVGVLGIVHETFFATVDRPTLLLLFAAMIGLPAFAWAERRNGDDK